LAEQLRALITRLDLQNYTPPSEEQQIAEQLANAQALVEQAISDSNIDRRAVAQRLEQAIQQWESSGPESPWYTAATQLRGLIAQLDLENYTPLSEQQLIDELIALYQSAFVDACNNPNINHVELQQNLEGLARWAARNQEVHIGYLRLSTELNALAAQLRNA
jgi:AcrR family transcriptional regulator